jgi:hypothetical protein
MWLFVWFLSSVFLINWDDLLLIKNLADIMLTFQRVGSTSLKIHDAIAAAHENVMSNGSS